MKKKSFLDIFLEKEKYSTEIFTILLHQMMQK